MTVSTAVDASAVARVVGIQVDYEPQGVGAVTFLPQRVAVIGQGRSDVTYSTTKLRYTNSLAVAQAYGFGSPLHLAARKLLPDNGDGLGTIPMTIYPLEDDGSGVAATSDITPAGAQTESASYQVVIGGIASDEFTILAGATVQDITGAIATAVNAVLEMPVIATDNLTDVSFVAKWAGTSGNDMTIEVVGSTTAGTTFAITQPNGGLINPSVQPALDQIGDVWETMILNCLETSDAANLDRYQTFGEGRWGSLVRKPLIVFSGDTQVAVNDAITVPDGRKDDRVNSQLVAPGSNELAFVVAARQLARIAKLANNNPPHDYGSQVADTINPGTDAEQWDYPTRDQAVKGGSSTVEVKDGVVQIADVVTFYHPTGDNLPPYRYVVDIVKLQNVIFNYDIVFASARWDGKPLIPDDQPTANPEARKPKTARADSAAILDALGAQAILSKVDVSKANQTAQISATNPKRLDMVVPITIAGNSNIIAIDQKWSFFFGELAIVA